MSILIILGVPRLWHFQKYLLPLSPFENLISEIISFLWWKETMSSTVSAFTTRKLPSFKPTARAFPSGENAQHLPPREKATRDTCHPTFTVTQAQWGNGEVCTWLLCKAMWPGLPHYYWELKFHNLKDLSAYPRTIIIISKIGFQFL